jgi:hypothetical protein
MNYRNSHALSLTVHSRRGGSSHDIWDSNAGSKLSRYFEDDHLGAVVDENSPVHRVDGVSCRKGRNIYRTENGESYAVLEEIPVTEDGEPVHPLE